MIIFYYLPMINCLCYPFLQKYATNHFSSSYGWKVDILDVRKDNLVIKFLEYKCGEDFPLKKCGEDFDFERLKWWL